MHWEKNIKIKRNERLPPPHLTKGEETKWITKGSKRHRYTLFFPFYPSFPPFSLSLSLFPMFLHSSRCNRTFFESPKSHLQSSEISSQSFFISLRVNLSVLLEIGWWKILFRAEPNFSAVRSDENVGILRVRSLLFRNLMFPCWICWKLSEFGEIGICFVFREEDFLLVSWGLCFWEWRRRGRRRKRWNLLFLWDPKRMRSTTEVRI